MSLHVGESYRILEQNEDGWWLAGAIGDQSNKTGLIPSNFLVLFLFSSFGFNLKKVAYAVVCYRQMDGRERAN